MHRDAVRVRLIILVSGGSVGGWINAKLMLISTKVRVLDDVEVRFKLFKVIFITPMIKLFLQ